MGFGDRMPFSSAIMKDVTFINERMLQVQVEKVRYTEEKKANLDECSLTLDHQTRQGKQTDTTTKRTIWKKEDPFSIGYKEKQSIKFDLII